MMFPDLTKVNVPLGLLDAETQAALKGHGGPYEYFGCAGEWFNVVDNNPMWTNELAYRVKPAPPKPREWWLVKHKHDETCVFSFPPGSSDLVHRATEYEIVHVREVLPE